MTFKKYWYLSFFRRNLNLQDPFPRYHQHLLQYIDCKVMFFVHVCAKCVCSDLRTTLSHLFWRVNVLYFVGIGSQPQKTGRHRNSPHRKSSHATMMVETGNHYRYGNGNMVEQSTSSFYLFSFSHYILNDVDTSNCKAMISMVKATCLFYFDCPLLTLLLNRTLLNV